MTFPNTGLWNTPEPWSYPDNARPRLSALVAEHDPVVRASVARGLRASGWTVTSARSAQELSDAFAVDVLDTPAIPAWDLVVARVDLAGGGAFPPLAAFRRFDAATPVVVYGGPATPDTRARARALDTRLFEGTDGVAELQRALVGPRGSTPCAPPAICLCDPASSGEVCDVRCN